MSEQTVTPGEPLLIEVVVDPTYQRHTPDRAYGWQIKDLGGNVVSYHYHAAPDEASAIASARMRFGADHPYTVDQDDPQPTADEQEQEAARLACAAFSIGKDDAEHMLDDPTGMAILVLLAAAGANLGKFDEAIPVRHQHKRILLRRAITMAADWWAAPHRYGDYADTVIFIETQFARFSYHCRRADPYLADLLATAPTSNRGWSGQPLQPYAERLAYGWMAGEAFAEDVITAMHAFARSDQ